MSHFAKIENDVVVAVVVGNPTLTDEQAEEWFDANMEGTWIRTSYNSKIRGNYAGIGMTYLPLEDIFIAPKCHDEAILNAQAAKWECTNTEHDKPEL